MNTLFSRILLVTAISILPASAGNQVLLRNLDAADGTPSLLAADHSGHLFVLSTLVSGPSQVTRVVKLDLTGARLASLDLPQMPAFAAAVTDAGDNLVIAGDDASFNGLLLKVDSQLHGALWSKSFPARLQAVTVDSSGNIYLTGTTSSATFPVTAGAYQTKPPGGDLHGSAAYAFVTEISPAGEQVLYSTYFGDDATNCIGGSACVGAYGSTTGTAIALDPSGAVVIAGATSASHLPTTPGALAQTCNCMYRTPAGFVAKFQPGASQQFVWSTFLNGTAPPNYSVGVGVDSMALDASGNVIVAGSGPAGLPTTPGTIQPSVITVPGTGDSGGFLIKLNATGTGVVWGTYFGGSPLSFAGGLHVDAQGRVLFSGVSVNSSQPVLPPSPLLAPSYVARLSPDAATLVDLYEVPLNLMGQSLVVDSSGEFVALGRSGALWIETANPGPSLLAAANAASNQYSTAVSPSELISLYGVGFGPQTPLSGEVQDGAFTTSLGGIQVLVDGIPAPLLYADSKQINAVVPRGIGLSAQIQVVTPAGTIDGPVLSRASYAPAIFQDLTTGMAAALNQDGTINSPSNPARPGSIVTIFANGGGSNYYAADGAIVPIGIYNSSAKVWVGGMLSYEVEFAGDAPGVVSGVMQINFRVPDSPPLGNPLSFSVEIGNVMGGPAQIAIAH